MTTFVLHLESATRDERIERVASFVGEDASGSFGILARHQRMVTTLAFGLARYRVGEDWTYLAMPGGLLYFLNNELFVVTRRYLRDTDAGRLVQVLGREFAAEEEALRGMKLTLSHLEDEILRRLWQMQRGAGRTP
ncbi:MAG: F0F1 ATP synthase subunit epsilon [Betaproteobacteria bacterium]|nr:F0F1 ATP synthase subunit epsilon [Betaproteobacteria bacterium]